jgi:predicted metal-dependent phosphoesterase TrpH
MIDLHSHSTASDGSLSPTALVRLALSSGLKALALTDHDTVDGISEARAAAAGSPMAFIPGVEIEIEFEPGEFHLLGLGIDETCPDLAEALALLASSRAYRNRCIVARLAQDGYAMDMERLKEASGSRSLEKIGRPHLADELARSRVVKTRQEAFDRFLGKGKPYYLSKECLPLEKALSVIRRAKGLAVVAHPYSLFVSKTRLATLMDEWKELGIDGIEAYHPGAKLGQCRILERMARERGFIVTAGSDYHNPRKPECGIGRSAGGIEISDAYMEGLSGILS